jgi:hypothetical protein
VLALHLPRAGRVGSDVKDLAKNNLASAQVFIFQQLGASSVALTPACKEHPSGEQVTGPLYTTGVMLTPEQINCIHQLHLPRNGRCARSPHLHLGRRTIAKYLAQPDQTAAPRLRASKLDSFIPAFWPSLASTNFLPRACHVRAAWEKGKNRTLDFLCPSELLAPVQLHRSGRCQPPSPSVVRWTSTSIVSLARTSGA